MAQFDREQAYTNGSGVLAAGPDVFVKRHMLLPGSSSQRAVISLLRKLLLDGRTGAVPREPLTASPIRRCDC